MDPHRRHDRRHCRIGRRLRAGGVDAIDEVGGGVAGEERLVAQGRNQEVTVGDDTAEMHSFEGQCQAACGLGPSRAVGDDLGEHRVEVDPDDAPLLDTAVPAHHRLVGRPVGRERAGGGQEVIVGILGVEAHLDRRADPVDVVLVVAEFGATRDPQLLPHEIDTGHLLGDRMLDLEAGVDLEKEELTRCVVDEELDRAGRLVAHVTSQRQRRLPHRRAHLGIDDRRR